MTFSVGQPEQTGLDLILRQLGGGASQGLQQGLAQFHEKKQQEALGNQFESLGLPRELAGLDPQIIKQLMASQQKQSLMDQLFGPSQGTAETLQARETPGVGGQPQPSQEISARDVEAATLLDPNLGRVRQQERKLQIQSQQHLTQDVRRSDIKRSDKYLDSINEDRDSTRRAKTSLSLIEQALERRDLGFFSPDNLKNMAGFDRWISPEGAILNTAGKEFFIADLERVTGRPNMFLEKILSGAMAQIGKSNEANEAIVLFYKNAVDLEEEKIKISDNLEDYYRQNMEYVPGNIGRLVDAQLKPYAQQQEKELVKIFQKAKVKFGKGTERKELHENLPSASASKGKRFKDTNTGIIYKSNGKNWKKVS